MAKFQYSRKAATNPVLRTFLQDSTSTTGAGLTGLSSTSTGLRIDVIRELDATVTSYTVAASNVETITTIGTYAAPTASKCRFKEVDATNLPGMYELQFAQALFGTGDASRYIISMIRGATSLAPRLIEIQLTAFDVEVAIAQTGDNYARIGAAGAGLTALGDTRIANLDATVSSRLATSGYTAPDNTNIGLIKVKTDNLPADPASNTQVNTRLATSGYTAPDNTTIGTINTKLGTPAGASVSVDIAAVKSDSGTILTRIPSEVAQKSHFVNGTGNITPPVNIGIWDRVDAAISSRSTYAGGAVASVTAGVTVATNSDKSGYSIAGTKTTLDALNDFSPTVTATESYAADNVAPTYAQLWFAALSLLGEYSVSGTTITHKKIDGVTTAMAYTVDSATAPTSRTRTT